MKKIIALFLVSVFCFCLISCGNNPDGIYYSGNVESGTYKKCNFDGGKIIIESYIAGKRNGGASIEGKYEIDGDNIIIRYENADGEDIEIIKAFETIDEHSIKIDSLIFKSES